MGARADGGVRPKVAAVDLGAVDLGAVDLAAVLRAAARGRPPTADGGVTVVPRADGGAVAGVIGFTAHHVVAADVDPSWVRSVLPPGSLSAPMSARFLAALADRVGAEPGAYDTVLVAPPHAVPLPELVPAESADSARLRRAERYRADVRAWTVQGAILIVGRGLAGRWEISLEVDPAYRGRGLGRTLVAAAPALVPPGATLWAQVSPANVASLRMFLAAGYRPVAAEVLFA
jgi:GNAT superfamily N-acetyltransferase